MKKTAALTDTPPGSVRVTWAASAAVEVTSPPGGVPINSEGDYVPDPKGSSNADYGASKVGNWFLAHQIAQRYSDSGIVSNAWNPGNLVTELQRDAGFVAKLLARLLLHDAKFGGYTELWAGWAEEAGKKEHNGAYVWPWGRFGGVRENLYKELEEGGNAEKFWAWCERETVKYA